MATLKSIKNKYLEASDGTVLGVTTNTENIAAISFKLATADSLSVFNLVDGFADDYQDAAGVDTSGSTNESLNASGYYSGGVAADATGGTITTYSSGGNDYKIHSFTSVGNTNFVVPGSGSADILLVAGGGGGAGGDGNAGAGGGGAGGFRALADTALTPQTYVVDVGDGGGGGGTGEDSSLAGFTAAGGAAGCGNPGGSPQNAGGSGGGGGGSGVQPGGAGNTPSTSPSQGNDGGAGSNGGGGPPCPNMSGGGGGGAGGNGGNASTAPVGSPTNGGSGGTGAANDYRTGSNITYAGGGGGGGFGSGGSGGSGGGGVGGARNSVNQDGTDGLGGGGGGQGHGSNTGSGGSGIVIVRYIEGAFVSYDNMTLLSNAFTAASAPTTARIILDEEQYTGATTLNTDIKAYASRDNGTTYTQMTLADQGQINYIAGIDTYTKLMLHMDGSNSGTTFTDSSATGHTMTASGNTHTDTAIKKIGTASAQFDGTGDYITSGASTEFSLTGDFTIDCWCYFGAINTTIAGSLSTWDWSAATTNDWIWIIDGDGIVSFNVKGVGSTGSSSGQGALNTWMHLAVQRASGTTSIYKNGALINTPATGPGSGTVSANNIVTLGRAASTLTGGYNGYIDEFRISKGIARYPTSFTPNTTAYTEARRLLSGSVDISGQPSGTSMKYKIETLNQAAAKQTRVYGTSMAWA